ncbi:uncharacterized protein LOC120177707 [Hibiscus syriacus]|uniref:uncharacterized protein LOC120177707 n=1 Tax=Hibiscus syriacus TaxID=106335 RepID=UPI0019218B14|nr:uncharacterized protein LOC120177707 [Hibiscus syriacus]
MLIDDQGRRLESFDEMATEVTEFFSGLLGNADPGVKNCDHNLLKDLMQFNLPPYYSSNLVKAVTDEEIKEANFNQGNEKALGPDGFTPYFFKKLWSVVEEDVIKAIKYFFQETFILPAFNATTIVLVPKVPNPNKVREFRPIFCCSVIYKTITKILVKRLTTLLPGIISRNQLAFVKGRNIVDNTLLAQELGARGIRQCDHISPILFVLAMNVLSIILNLAAARGLFRYLPKCKKIGLTHISFIDDLLIFCKGNIESITRIISALDQFYELSGLKLNAAKCELYTAGISFRNLEHIL